ncbi:hypothetical protein N7495_009628 [Penicillium taxi]|uniref:uncharacterized protein n=1 Tax=Penicillium taxi TaxID=168475 RepID=UPI002545B33F|nr:uncharacterized protein N7495_009628 [Penicillium taxi]KAJ5885118.1 hypothetical protein N7495_009628 [Penicillium taxi]
MPQTDVLIVGAGPTGLVLALWLYKQGLSFRIIDEAEAPAPNSRALVVHARILELYRQLNLAEDILAAGYKIPATNIWVDGQHRAHISLKDFGNELTPYPYMLAIPQDDHERLLEKRLNTLGIFVERCTKLQNFVDRASSITATLLQDNNETTCGAAYIVGCDGAHSTVRHIIGAKFEGDTYIPLFYIADINAKGNESPFFNGEAHLAFVEETFNLILPYEQGGRVRLIGTKVDKDNSNDGQQLSMSANTPELTFENVLPDIEKTLRVAIKDVKWFSPYRSHHRVSEKFRSNRAFLVGDAAHIHSPVGGQGMNTGIMDAINLAWKLATAIKKPNMSEESKNNLLDSYETERRAFALTIVGATDRGFTALTAPGFLPHMLRSWIIPYAAPLITPFRSARMEIFRRASQLVCTYRGSPLNLRNHSPGIVQPGDRLPWTRTESADNFSTLHDISWQLHVYGDQRPELVEWCCKMNVQFFGFKWNSNCGLVGLKKDFGYLLRPDHYIAGILEGDSIEQELDEYFSSHVLQC